MTEPGAQPAGQRGAVPVLILGKGITALGVLRSFGRRAVPAYVVGASGDLLIRSRWYKRPPGDLATEFTESDLAARLESLDVARMVLIPTSDKWAMAVSRLPPRLSQRFPAHIVAPDILERLIDKARFAQTVAEMGLPHPRTALLPDADTLRSLPAEHFRDSFLKPTQSGPFAQAFGAKAIRFKDRDDALRVYDEATGKGFGLILQEFIPGPPDQHYFIEGFIDEKGRVCGLFARRRLRMFPRDFGNSTSTVSIPAEEVASAADALARLLRGIGYHGVFSAEFKLDDRDGLLKVLEINARPWWFVGFAAQCGIDVCDMAYRDALGEELQPVLRYRIGRRCVYPRLDLESGLAEWRAARLGLFALLRSWIGADQLVLCRDDPSPGAGEIFAWVKSRLRRKLGW